MERNLELHITQEKQHNLKINELVGDFCKRKREREKFQKPRHRYVVEGECEGWHKDKSTMLKLNWQ